MKRLPHIRKLRVPTLPRWAVVALVVVPAALAYAQVGGVFTLSWSTTEGGGVTHSTGGTYALDGTVGQPEAGTSSGGRLNLSGGFEGGGSRLASHDSINRTSG